MGFPDRSNDFDDREQRYSQIQLEQQYMAAVKDWCRRPDRPLAELRVHCDRYVAIQFPAFPLGTPLNYDDAFVNALRRVYVPQATPHG